MKKIAMKSLIALTIMLLSSVNAIAQTFKGTLSNVTMNGKHFNNVENIEFVL